MARRFLKKDGPFSRSLTNRRSDADQDADCPYENGRLMVLIAFNNDVSDSWQWADDAHYPAESANLGLRLGVNIAVYALTR
jgi:Domain of unknown function (DUF4159)